MTVLSGCIGGGEDAEETTAANPNGTNPSPSESDDPTPTGVPENHAPMADLAATTSEGGSGRVAVDVDAGSSVTLDASGSSDPDDDPLAFAWTVDGAPHDSTNSTITVEVDEGEHTVEVTVSDGELDDSASILINAVVPELPTGAAKAVVLQFKGVFNQGDAVAEVSSKSSPQALQVPAGAKQITAWLRWDDHATGNTGVVTDLDLVLKDAAGTQQGSSARFVDFEYIRLNDTTKISPGDWTLDVIGYHVPAKTDWTLDAIVWLVAPTVQTFDGTVQGGVNVGGAGAVTPSKIHTVAIPADASIVAGRLTWASTAGFTGSCDYRDDLLSDYDLYVRSGGAIQFQSGNGAACEFGFKAADDGAALDTAGTDWAFEVVPFLTTSAKYTLTVEYA